MLISLPNLKETYCRRIVACGNIVTKSQKVLSLLHGKPKTLIARYSTGDAESWVLASYGSIDPKITSEHFHLEVFVDKQEEEEGELGGRLEEVSLGAIQELCKLISGRKIVVKLGGNFVIPVKDVAKDSIASILGNRKHKNGVTVKTVAAAYTIENALIDRIGCRVSEDMSEFIIEMNSVLGGKIHSGYLIDFADFLDTALRVHFLGARVTDAPNS